MLSRHLRHHSVAYLALVVALSTGTAYAAPHLANGSVTTKKLAKDAVVSKKIRDGSVTGGDLMDRSVSGVDVLTGSLGSAEVADGSITDDDLGTGSVGSAEVKNGSLTAPDLAEGSVGTNEVKNGSLGAADLAAGVVPADTQITLTRGAGGFTPSGNPDWAGLASTSINMSAAGHAYVSWSMFVGQSCSSGTANIGLYVDDTPVSGSAVPLVASPGGFTEVSGYLALTTGPHTAKVGIDCPTGDLAAGNTGGAGTWTVIVPGE